MHVNYKQSVIVIIYQMTKTSGVLWDNAYSSVRYHSLTKSSSLPLEHKTPTNLLHLAQSWANQQSSSQFFQARFMSSSTVFLQVPSGLAASFSRLCPIQSGLHVEGYFCPCGEHDQAASTHLLCFTSSATLSVLVRLEMYVLVTRYSQRIHRIRLRQLPTNPLSRF